MDKSLLPIEADLNVFAKREPFGFEILKNIILMRKLRDAFEVIDNHEKAVNHPDEKPQEGKP